MFQKILVAVDGSPLSEKAVKAAAAIAKPASTVTLMHVVINPPIPYAEGYLEVERQLRKYGEEILNRSKELARSLGVGVETRVEVGDIAEEILRIADAENYDLIIVGSRGLSRVKSFLIGSVSSRVARYSTRSVLIIR